MLRTAAGLLLTAATLAAPLQPTQPSRTFDVLIRNGRVMDGSGNPSSHADIGILGDRIVFVGDLAGAQTKDDD